MGITVFLQNNTTLRRSDQGAHIRERLTANRSDLTLQGGPNQHGTYMPTIPLPASNYRTTPPAYSQPSPTRYHQK